MPAQKGSLLSRAVLIALILCLLAPALPRSVVTPAQAAPSAAVVLNFNVIAVKKDASVTIRTKDFPLRTKFTVSMDAVQTTVGKKTADTAVEAGQLDSAQGGEIEASFPIPQALRGKLILSIRIESKDGYTSSNWFFNEDLAAPPAKTGSTTTSAPARPEVSFAEVKKGSSVTVEAGNLPANTTFWVRIGPYYSFYRDYISLAPVQSGPDGQVKFSIQVPEKMQASDYFMVRLDGGGIYTYAIYQNIDGGKAVEEKTLYKFSWCKLVMMRDIPAKTPGEHFDVVWTIQNTSNQTWKANKIAYKYYSGEEMQKYKNFYPLTWDIQDGWHFDVAVDMIAPKTPGWHTTQWAIYNPRTDTVMCTMKASVFVTDAKK